MAENSQQNAADCASRLEEMSVNEEESGNGPTSGEDVVTPWNVESATDDGVDYDKLISKLQCLHLLKFTYLRFS